MKHREAGIALRRFGLGPRSGDLDRIAGDPRGYVLAALLRKDGAVVSDSELEPSHLSFQAMRAAQMENRSARRLLRDARPSAGPEATSPAVIMQQAEKSSGNAPGNAVEKPPKPGEIRREVFREEARVRLTRAATTDQPFLERLVYFWSNHFSVSAQKGQMVRVLAGAFEREAIRPHVLGRFAEMLKAVEQHPAMLIYLDNAQSIGPNSPAGRNRGKGLNENLAREILELHTLGVSGGYNQTDVTSFAKIITGWTVADPQMAANLASSPRVMAQFGGREIVPGRFIFTPQRHEPGAQMVLGKRYEDTGQVSGEAVLTDLARHPATARHIATKLAQHFVADKPPPELVKRLESAFAKSGGDLAAVSRALVDAPECWTLPARKVVPPNDFVVSLIRAFDLKPRPPEAMRIAAAIGQPLWTPPSPKGWPDDDDAWMGPSAVRERLRIAERAAREIDRSLDPRAVATDLFGEALSNEAKLAIERAEAREQGFELLMMSPEFLRR